MTTILPLPVACVLLAQSPAFEVASLKPNRTGSLRQHYPFLRKGTIMAENAPLKWLIEAAYGINGKLIYGPPWLDTDRFDVSAKAPAGVPDSEFRSMLQALLRNRFHLTLHSEKREMDAFDMVVSKGGLKLKRFDPSHEPGSSPNLGGQPGGRSNPGGWVLAGGGTLKDLAGALILAADRPVVDRTGVAGPYVWELHYTPLSASPTDNPAAPPDVFTAVRTQLGLKLDSRKQPIDVLVVDSVKRIPDAN